ncbi:MAG: AraC family transcriptional regulator, partial [Propionibacteriales bacterium]|nr:AraC family transcriptional regulator [Propionibacteriales bacterium]
RLHPTDAAMPGLGTAMGYRADGQAPGVHLGVPSPSLTFILSLDGPVVGAWSGDDLSAGRTEAGEVVLSGLHTHASYVRQPVRQEGIQFAVDPTWSRALFGVPASAVTGAIADPVLGTRGRRLIEQVAENPDWRQRFDLVGQELRQWASADTAPARPEMVEAWRWLVSRRGRASIGDLSHHVLLSERQLRQEFRREYGVGPKEAARLIRFQQATRRMAISVRCGRSLSLAGVAADSGYADQAHLAREFSGFLGVSPSQWVATERRNLQAGGHMYDAES